jgi:hypothetical protein
MFLNVITSRYNPLSGVFAYGLFVEYIVIYRYP